MAKWHLLLTWPYLRNLQGYRSLAPLLRLLQLPSGALFSNPWLPTLPQQDHGPLPSFWPELNAVPCPAWHMRGKWGGVPHVSHHPPRWHGALPSPAQATPLTSACPCRLPGPGHQAQLVLSAAALV